jgi:hypothetical protein
MTSSLLLFALLAAQQAPPRATPDAASEPFAIIDNSFLVEEAFNQEPRIVQNIFGWIRQQQGDWLLTFTQEWPVPAMRHQLSYTIPVSAVDGRHGVGDVLVNYRLQVLEEGTGRPAFAPRVSAQLPTGDPETGGGAAGVQVNLPFSKRRRDLYFHWNAGFTWLPSRTHPDLLSPALAGSAIYRVARMCNLMLESVLLYQDAESAPGGTQRTRSFTLSPGVRTGWNVSPEKQVVIGAAVPVTFTLGTRNVGVFGYFSYELAFRKQTSPSTTRKTSASPIRAR